MSSNLSPEELRALAEGGRADGAAAAGVSQWERGRVRRLSADDVSEARRRIGRSLPRIESRLVELCGLRAELRLGACSEVDAEGVLDGVEDPPALVCFRVGGQPGWCLWDNPTAVATVEDVLGGAPPPLPVPEDEESEEDEDDDDGKKSIPPTLHGPQDEEEGEPPPPPFDPEAYRRFLTPLERNVLVRVLRVAIDEVAAVLGVTVEGYEAVVMLKHAPTWREPVGARPDPHRLAVELLVETERNETAVTIHLPMVGARGPLERTSDREPAGAGAAHEVPDHLDEVPVEVEAELGGAELTLRDLVELEPGDVIPLDTAVGDPIHLRAAGVVFAVGAVGQHRGHVAVRVTADGPDELPTPKDEKRSER